MPKTVFVSYSWTQGEWVWDRLVPCLRASGAEVLIDREQFETAKALERQMTAIESRADVDLLVFSPEYLASENCRHEMERALLRDPQFEQGVVVPVKRVDCALPASIQQYNPLYVDLRNDRDEAPWRLLLAGCEGGLGVPAPEWLAARDSVRRFLTRGDSVNLVVQGAVKWRPLIDSLRDRELSGLRVVDLESADTISRPGLVKTILSVCGVSATVPRVPDDLVLFKRVLIERGRTYLAFIHFDWADKRQASYGPNLYATLRNLMTDSKSLVLLIQSRTPFAALASQTALFDPDSRIDLKTVELKAKS